MKIKYPKEVPENKMIKTTFKHLAVCVGCFLIAKD